MRKPGFTLVELLVVITVIVVLLALLLPAMSKAIYQATLAQCASNLHTTTSGVQSYAFHFQRYYPARGFDAAPTGPMILVGGPTASTQTRRYDMRPPLDGYVQVNKQLNCPFAPALDLDLRQPAPPYTMIMASYAMWWDWTYTTDSRAGDGMFKVGDRWQWDGTTYGLLMSDYELWWNASGWHISSSHPDLGGGLSQLHANAADNVPIAAWFGNGTISGWINNSTQRGLLDMNYGYDDGSVVRANALKREDQGSTEPRLNDVPYYRDTHDFPAFTVYMPR